MIDTIDRLHALKEAIRRPYCWPGGYTIALYLRDSERICNRCAREEWREIVYDSINGYGTWQAGYTDVHWEGPPQDCIHCNEPQSSEYGDPDNEE